jgi:hypothetical protein
MALTPAIIFLTLLRQHDGHRKRRIEPWPHNRYIQRRSSSRE